MIAVIVALCGALSVTAIVLGAVVHAHGRERQAWAVERSSLVDRAIARHTGEVLAFDRAKRRPVEAEQKEPLYVEGLS